MGETCVYRTRVRKDVLERAIIDPILQRLRDPTLVAQMAKEMEAEYARRVHNQQQRRDAVPHEVQVLEERIARYRTMEDLDADERQALIDKAQARRAELLAALTPKSQGATILTVLPKAASMYLRTIERGLEGDARAATRARAILRQILGDVRLWPSEHGALYATHFRDLWCLVKHLTGTGHNLLAT